MIPQFEKLTPREQELLVKAPVLLSVLASCSEHGINQKQKADAIKLAHIKTFTALPELQSYFREAEKILKNILKKQRSGIIPLMKNNGLC